jgi:hypothetical protein
MIEKAIAGAIAVLITWATWITRRSFVALSRREHDAICEKRNKELKQLLIDMNAGIERDRKETKEHREALSEQLAEVNTKVAVLYDRSERGE